MARTTKGFDSKAINRGQFDSWSKRIAEDERFNHGTFLHGSQTMNILADNNQRDEELQPNDGLEAVMS